MHEWEIDPALYEGIRTFGYKGMDDLADAVEKIPEAGEREDGT